tara:strand:- start:403 stop:876 length:474 start_codon:yes stop_codon:yes gene_type:complete
MWVSNDKDDETDIEEDSTLLFDGKEEEKMDITFAATFTTTTFAPTFTPTPQFIYGVGDLEADVNEWSNRIRECIRREVLPFINVEAVHLFFDTMEKDMEYVYDKNDLNRYFRDAQQGNFHDLMVVVSDVMGCSWTGAFGEPNMTKVMQRTKQPTKKK